MKIHYKKSDIFVPYWNDNKKEKPENQIKFHHRFLTVEERKRFVYWEDYTEGQITVISVLAAADKLSVDDQIKALEKDDRKFVQNGMGIAKMIVTKIENLVLVDESGKEEKIDTIEKFYAAIDAFPGLRFELERYCLGVSAKADSKNS